MLPTCRYTDLQRYLYLLECKQFPYFQRELLVRTEQSRRVDLLTISNPKNLVSDGRVRTLSPYTKRRSE